MAEALPTAIVTAIADAMRPLLTDKGSLQRLGIVTKDKGQEHTAHEIDLVAEEVLMRTLREAHFQGLVFSEEAGLVRLGGDARLVVCDPYCNTTLTFRGVRESAVAAYEYQLDGSFLAGAIADVQVPRLVEARHGEPARTRFWLEEAVSSLARPSAVRSLDEAYVVASLLKRNRRASPPMQVLSQARTLTTVDGAIVALRLAVGDVDAFFDSTVGQPSYEALAYELVARAGCVVSDPEGSPIDFSTLVQSLASGEVRRQRMVIACTAELHEQSLAALDAPASSHGAASA